MKSILNKKDGFTLLEALIALMLSSMIIILLAGGLVQMDSIRDVVISEAQSVSTSQTSVEGDRQMEWHLFLNQFENALKETRFISVVSSELTVDEWNEDAGDFVQVRYGVTKSSTSNFIRDNKGYNRMLSGISQYTLERQGEFLLLDFTFKNGENYKGRIGIDSWAKEGAIEKE